MRLELVLDPIAYRIPPLRTVYFRLVVRKRNIEFQIDESHSSKLSSWLNAIGQFIFQYCVMWTTNLKFTVLKSPERWLTKTKSAFSNPSEI